MTYEQLTKLCNSTARIEPASPIHEHLIPLAVRLVLEHLQPGSEILDVGCGLALTAAEIFKKEGHKPICISVFEEEVEAAKNLGFEAYCHDLHDLSSYKEKHLVWLRHVAEHAHTPLKLLFEAYEATSEIGMLYLEVPDPWTSSMHELNPNHWSVLNWESWLHHCDFAGWKRIISGKFPMLTGRGPDCYSYGLFVKK